MKKYYSSVREYDKRKYPYPFFTLVREGVRLFFPKCKVVWKTEKPEGPVFFVSNHTKLFAPTFFVLQKPAVRPWLNYYFLFPKDCWGHLKNKVLTGKRAWLKPLGFLLTPLIVALMRGMRSVPVYHSSQKVLNATFKKSVETMESGVSQVIFPERTENKVNRYVYELNAGFPMVADVYYRETGKILQFFPVYCAPALKTVVVGEPIAYDPAIPMKKQRQDICRYLENAIKELGDGLPAHEPTIYG